MTNQNSKTEYPAETPRFTYVTLFFATWFVVGLFTDGWAHNNIPNLETFFTPWHGILYSGFILMGAYIVWTHTRNVWRGYTWTRALPRGYMLTLLGVVIFTIGGLSDFAWHTLLGIEASVEALFSPPHLTLATGAMLFMTGALRANWARTGGRGWRELLPVVWSLGLVMAGMTFFSQYANIFTNIGIFPAPRWGQDSYLVNVSAVSDMVFTTAILTGVLLFALRRWQLPFGAFTLLLTINAVGMFALRFDDNQRLWLALLAAPITGLLADLFVARWRPSAERVGALRVLAFLLPALLSLTTLLVISLTTKRGIWWTPHMWLGLPYTVGLIGLGLSFLVAPPRLPE